MTVEEPVAAPTGATEVHVIKVTNLNQDVDEAMFRELFENIGTIAEVMIVEGPPMMPTGLVMKVGFVRFESVSDRDVALYLNRLVLLDRQIFVAKVEEFPRDNMHAIQLMLPPPPKLPQPILTPAGPPPRMPLVVPTNVPKNVVVPPYPELAPNLEAERVDEIRRTVYCGNLTSYTTAEDLKRFFALAGEVLFCRMAGDETQPTRFAFVEFQTKEAEHNAVRLSGVPFFGRSVKVNHSKNAVSKPPELRAGMKGKEATEAMRKVNSVAQRVARKKERLEMRKRDELNKREREKRREKEQEDIDRAREERRRRREAEHAAADKRMQEQRDKDQEVDRDRDRDRDGRRSRSRRSRSPERRRRSKSPDQRRRSRSRSRSRSPRAERSRRLSGSGGGTSSDRKRRKDHDGDDDGGREKEMARDKGSPSGDEPSSRGRGVKLGGMRAFD